MALAEHSRTGVRSYKLPGGRSGHAASGLPHPVCAGQCRPDDAAQSGANGDFGALEPAFSPAQEALGQRSVREFLAYLRDLVADRHQHPGDPEHDVLTHLIQSEKDDGHGGDQGVDALSDVELLHNCVFLLNAGHETTTNLIGNALISLQIRTRNCWTCAALATGTWLLVLACTKARA